MGKTRFWQGLFIGSIIGSVFFYLTRTENKNPNSWDINKNQNPIASLDKGKKIIEDRLDHIKKDWGDSVLTKNQKKILAKQVRLNKARMIRITRDKISRMNRSLERMDKEYW